MGAVAVGNGIYRGQAFIKPDAFNAMHVPLTYMAANPLTGNHIFYGLGWITEYDVKGRTIWWHNGAFSKGACTLVTLYPQDRLGIVVLSNAFPTGLPEAVTAEFFSLIHNEPLPANALQVFEEAMSAPITRLEGRLRSIPNLPLTPRPHRP